MQDAPAPFSVLVADAEPTICRVFEAKLTKEGRFRVACASTGPDAYRLALLHPFDVLLWDLRMRDSDSLLPRLRALCPDAALLLMSTDDQPAISVPVARLDVAGILVKPFGLDTLETHLRSVLAQRYRQQPLYHVGFVGQYVTIRTPAGECLTRVFENEQDSFLVIGAPRVATPPDFVTGLKVEVEYNGRGALYSFDSELLREVTDPLPCWELAMPSTIRRNQRREVPRTALQKPIQLHSVSDPSDVLCKGTTTDISAQGLALLSNSDMEPGTQVQFTISRDIHGRATVVRSQPQTGPNGAMCYCIALRFDHRLPELYLQIEKGQ
ncbi:MAG: Response regulator of citrate/malate metabolism [Chthonomonadales bacterium]|nr:Response regulator of citrate/malate metabolism [Chthonomonadales bacterium]